VESGKDGELDTRWLQMQLALVTSVVRYGV
jgi:hypothetical protein